MRCVPMASSSSINSRVACCRSCARRFRTWGAGSSFGISLRRSFSSARTICSSANLDLGLRPRRLVRSEVRLELHAENPRLVEEAGAVVEVDGADGDNLIRDVAAKHRGLVLPL